MTSGLLMGLLARENFDYLTGCLKDPIEFNTSIQDAVGMIETKTNENIALGVQKLADTVQGMPAQLSNCEKSHEDAAALQAWADSLPDSGEFEQRILKNLKSNSKQVKLGIAHASV